MDKKKIKVVTCFTGIGMQERGIENTGLFDMEIVNTCEMDSDAIVSYAAIHHDLTKEKVENYDNYPSREEMAQQLEDKHIGYDFIKDKPYDWQKLARSKDNKMRLQTVWLADKLNKNVGDICRVDKFPYCDLLTFSFPCFVEGTMVLTKNGYKEIQDVEVGDEVLTHTNSWQKVVKTMTNEADKIVSINCMPSEKIYCTPNHPFYVRKLNRIHNSKTGCSERKFDSPQWIAAEKLDNTYYVGTAINQIEELPIWNGFEKNTTWGHTKHENTLSDKMNTKDFWYIIGRYIGDGWLRTGGGIIICANKDEVHQITPYLERLEFNYNISQEKTAYKIHIPFQEIGEYCKQFGKGAANKHLTNDILNLPINLLQEFIKGYIDSDGCFTQNKYKISSISRRLIYEVAQCVSKAYHVPTSVYFCQRKKQAIIEGRTVNQRDTYELSFKLDKRLQDHAFYEDGYIWSPIKEINIYDTNELVYNLEVENDNSYQVQNIIVHNCTDLSIAGRQAGMIEGETRSGLVYEVLRILKNMKAENNLPTYLLMENVDALVNKKNKPQYEALNGEFSDLGYDVKWQVLNGKNCGVPQNRSRIFAIYWLRDEIDLSTFEFPLPFDDGRRLKDVLLDEVDEKYYITNERAQALIRDLVMNGKVVPTDETVKKNK